MVGCRYNAKNTTTKNYLHLAQRLGAVVQAESEVVNIEELLVNEPDDARYEVMYKRSTAILPSAHGHIRARNIVLAGGVLGTLKLLFHCRDASRTLPRISRRLGDMVRTNSEALLGATSRDDAHDFSQGLAITSVAQLDEHTRIEPVRYPVGSSLMRWLSAPLIHMQGTTLARLMKSIVEIIRHPRDYMHVYLSRRWAQRTTILLVMQTKDNHLRLRLSRKLSSLFRYTLGADHVKGNEQDVQAQILEAHKAVRSFAQRANAVPASSVFETLLNLPTTAHILGGCPIGLTPEHGVVDLQCRLHGHEGIIVADGSIMPGNLGINPSLTITALAEYAMSHVPNQL
jgi:cholesterol oxidase